MQILFQQDANCICVLARTFNHNCDVHYKCKQFKKKMRRLEVVRGQVDSGREAPSPSKFYPTCSILPFENLTMWEFFCYRAKNPS